LHQIISSAFVLGAGLGTRLRPLTDRLPKPLVPVGNRPLIAWGFDHLIDAGIQRLVVNTHHLPACYNTAFPGGAYRGVPIIFRHEPVLLETAGGIANVADLFPDETFLVFNGDILTTLPVENAIAAHKASGNEVTLVLRSSGGPLQIGFDAASGLVCDIGGKLGDTHSPLFLFSGVYVVSPAFVSRIPVGEKISVIPVFLQMIREGARLGAVVIDEGTWWDLGSPEAYLAAHELLGCTVDPAASLDPQAEISDGTTLGSRVTVGPQARLRRTVVWHDAIIAAGTTLDSCIVLDGACVSGHHVGEILQ